MDIKLTFIALITGWPECGRRGRAGGVGVRAGPNSGRAQAAGKGRGDPGAAALPGPPPAWCSLVPPNVLA